MTIDPALNVPCPTCYVKTGEPCRSRHAVTLHQSRRQSLEDLGVQADDLLAAYPRKPVQAQRQTVFVGRTGEGNVIPADVDWPPWEAGPSKPGKMSPCP